MIVRRLFNCCETIVEGIKEFFNDFKTIVERLLKDCFMTVKRLLKDG